MRTSYIYVLHFDQKLAHARHYIGCTATLAKRLEAHANGAGARLMEVIKDQGITWELGGLYSCSHAEMRRWEKKLKSIHNSHRFCQLCHPKDQQRVSGLQTENIELVQCKRRSLDLIKNSVEIHSVAEMEQNDEARGMAFIQSLMRKDKDALGFVPIGGVKGIHGLLEKRQIVLSYENGEPCGYAFYTLNPSKTVVSIHQACTADDARLKGHGADVVEFIAEKHPDTKIVAKVRDDLAANHFWTAMRFAIELTKTHATSGSTIHHYVRSAKP